MATKRAKKPDNKIRWKADDPRLVELRDMLPDVDVAPYDRGVALVFNTQGLRRRFIKHMAQEEDLEIEDGLRAADFIMGCYRSWSFELDRDGDLVEDSTDMRVRKEYIEGFLRCLRRLGRLRPAATAAETPPAVGTTKKLAKSRASTHTG